MCRLAAAHKTNRLMLLGLPPDMVHGVSLHRARTSIFRNFKKKSLFQKLHTVIILYHAEINLSSIIYKKRGNQF